MKKEVFRFCEYCNYLLPEQLNNNAKKRAEQILLLKNDNIIHELYLLYEDKFYISSIHLINQDFYWSIYNQDIIIHSTPAKSLIRYAYTLYKNNTVRLWKL
jgi:hypothetical protein